MATKNNHVPQKRRNGALTAVLKIITTLCLTVSLVGVGLWICCLPFVTTMLSSTFSVSVNSPFTHEELVEAAETTRDYTVGSHNKEELYDMLYSINRAAQEAGSEGPGAPKLPSGEGVPSVEELESAFSKASDEYVLTPDAVSHLDDVYNVISGARIALIVCAVIALTGCIFLGFRNGRRSLGWTLMISGTIVVAAFAAFGIWAAVDFTSFFSFVHSLFFAAGTWTFSADSLLITMYPPAFWTGMGVVWLISTGLASILCFIVGLLIKGKKRKA